MSMDTAYAQVLREIKDAPELKASMGLTREVWGHRFTLTDPQDRVVYNPVRMFNIYQSVGQWMWMISGRSDYNFIRYYNPTAKKFSYDLRQIEGAYGPRLFGAGAYRQIPRLIESMQRKATSRRTVATIYDAGYDTYREEKKDPGQERSGEIPCTLSLQFLLREGKVHCVTTMRSQDAYGLLPQDVFHFTMFQEMVAASVGADMGTYLHQAASMHYYPLRVADLTPTINAVPAERHRMPRMEKGDQTAAMLDTIALEERIRLNAIEVREQEKDYAKGDLEAFYKAAKALPPFWSALAQTCLVQALIHAQAWARLEQVINRLDPWLLPFARVSLQMKTGQQFLSNYAFSSGSP
jgi:thymidylate synthase